MTDVQPLLAEELAKIREIYAIYERENRTGRVGPITLSARDIGGLLATIDAERSDKAYEAWLREQYRDSVATIAQQAGTIRELKAALEEEQRKFQAETLRTSALTQLLVRAEAVLCPEHEPGAWSRSCERCSVVADSRKLRATPINAAALTSTEARDG